MTKPFYIRIPPTNVGPGSVENVGDLVRGFGVSNVLIVTDSGVLQAGLIDKIKPSLEKSACKYFVFDGCKQNAPSSVIEQCSRKAAEGSYDLLIGIGGGSVLDTTKMVSIVVATGKRVQDLFNPANIGKKALPKILIPTTSGTGSEWSSTAVFTDDIDGQKKAARGPALFADAVILDPQLTLGLPKKLTAETGFDALTHAIEAYVNPGANIVGDMFAETAIKLVSDKLRLVYAKGSNLEDRYNMHIAASLGIEAGAVEGGLGLAHLIDGFIVTRAHISHGEALSILLTHVMAFNIPAAPERFAKIAELMGERIEGLSVLDAAKRSLEAVRRLSQDLGLKQTLGEVGITAVDIPQIVDDVFTYKAAAIPLSARRNAGREDISQILNDAL